MNQLNHSNYLNKNRTEEQQLYDYFMFVVQNESPKDVLDNFRTVFLDGSSQKNELIYSVLEKLLKGENMEQN